VDSIINALSPTWNFTIVINIHSKSAYLSLQKYVFSKKKIKLTMALNVKRTPA
jgi:hypothetical protein